MPTYDEYLQRIAEVDAEIKSARLTVEDCRRKLVEAEDNFLFHKINKEKLVEEFRVFKNTRVTTELTSRQQDIARFKEVLPEIIENDKWTIKDPK